MLGPLPSALAIYNCFIAPSGDTIAKIEALAVVSGKVRRIRLEALGKTRCAT